MTFLSRLGNKQLPRDTRRYTSGAARQISHSLGVLLIVFLLITTVTLLGPMSAQSAEECYAQWHLNEDSGTTVVDTSGNSRDGNAQNMNDANWVSGKLNNGLQFGSVDNQYVNCGSIAGFDYDDEVSFEIWVKAGAANRDRYLFGKGTEQSGIGVLIQANGDLKAFLHRPGGFTQRRVMRTVDTNLEDNEWHHIVVTYDGSGRASGLILYVDGSIPTTVDTGDNLEENSIVTSHNLTIGATDNGTAYTFRDGILDEVVIYDHVLSSSQVAFRYANGNGTESSSPAVTFTSPNFAAQGATTDITITGTDFAGATSVSFGSGITTNNYTIDSSTQISADITVDGDAVLGTRDVSVDVGEVVGTLSAGFNIVSPSTATSISPSYSPQGGTLDIVITGTGFTGAAYVSFGMGVTTNSYIVDSPTQITANITVDSDATLGTRDVSVSVGGIISTLPDVFTITSPPLINSVSPNSALQGSTIDIAIIGTDFTDVTGISCGTGVSVNSYTIDNPTQISANISIAGETSVGSRDIAVMTDTLDAILENGFTVVAAPVIPSISAINPTSGVQGTIIDLTITGMDLTGASAVSLGDGINIDSYTVDSPTQITVRINIDVDSAIGARDVSVTTDGGIGNLAEGFSVIGHPAISGITVLGDANPGETIEVIITGTNLTGVVDISMGDGITVNSFTLDSPTQITAVVEIAADANVGPRDIVVGTDGQSASLQDGLNVQKPNASPEPSNNNPWLYFLVALFAATIGGVLVYRRRKGIINGNWKGQIPIRWDRSAPPSPVDDIPEVDPGAWQNNAVDTDCETSDQVEEVNKEENINDDVFSKGLRKLLLGDEE
ncbi:MAG: LamG-like jellyroll fold domain-containing protein [Chloroflexota bacterium]|nr:LamG-like jellyroll fold domain-containing protein [Chloroflexota bacterium]